MTSHQTPTPAVPVLLADVATMAQIIDICSKRGSFKAEELAVVGELFQRLVAHFPKPEQTTTSATATPAVAVANAVRDFEVDFGTNSSWGVTNSTTEQEANTKSVSAETPQTIEFDFVKEVEAQQNNKSSK